jgi:hypothetical protein
MLPTIGAYPGIASEVNQLFFPTIRTLVAKASPAFLLAGQHLLDFSFFDLPDSVDTSV